MKIVAVIQDPVEIAFEMDPGTKQYIKLRAEETLYDWTNDPIMVRITESSRDFQTLNEKIYGVA